MTTMPPSCSFLGEFRARFSLRPPTSSESIMSGGRGQGRKELCLRVDADRGIIAGIA